jgi:hypothetical protein
MKIIHLSLEEQKEIFAELKNPERGLQTQGNRSLLIGQTFWGGSVGIRVYMNVQN